MARGLETFLAVLVLGVTSSPAAADPLLREFSVCAGRYSALVEHQWLVDGPASEISTLQRDNLLALVDAVAEPGQQNTALNWRIDAKAAHGALLNRAYFAQDETAAARSKQLLQACAALIGQS
jgi:hypothetical protein